LRPEPKRRRASGKNPLDIPAERFPAERSSVIGIAFNKGVALISRERQGCAPTLPLGFVARATAILP